MNKVIEVGRLTRNPEIRYTQGAEPMEIARYTLAVDRRQSRNNDNQQSADFIPCVAFGKLAEFAEKYLAQGVKIVIEGHLQSGSYTNKDGNKVYTLDVIIESQEFAESKATNQSHTGNGQPAPAGPVDGDGFMNIPDGIDGELPFN
jgi:single-strand DNA-binding protein